MRREQAVISVKCWALVSMAKGERWKIGRSLKQSVAQSQGSGHTAQVLFLKLEILEIVTSFKTPNANAYECAREKTFLISFSCGIQ